MADGRRFTDIQALSQSDNGSRGNPHNDKDLGGIAVYWQRGRSRRDCRLRWRGGFWSSADLRPRAIGRNGISRGLGGAAAGEFPCTALPSTCAWPVVNDKPILDGEAATLTRQPRVNLCALCSRLRGKASYGAVDPPCFR
jgi:hypothetical protein